MKNFVKILGLAAVLAVAGCSGHRSCRDCGYRAEPQPVYQAPMASCGERTTREPVEIVYRRTSYRTVYEPRTTRAVSYEREPYSGQCS